MSCPACEIGPSVFSWFSVMNRGQRLPGARHSGGTSAEMQPAQNLNPNPRPLAVAVAPLRRCSRPRACGAKRRWRRRPPRRASPSASWTRPRPCRRRASLTDRQTRLRPFQRRARLTDGQTDKVAATPAAGEPDRRTPGRSCASIAAK
jgi:hypothetical protein